jgi:hypothetical protein
MRKTYKQLPNGKLVETTPARPLHAGTFQAGDIPDMMKDVERRKRDLQKQDARERKQTIIDTVNRYG